MKRIFIILALLIVSINIFACKQNEKKPFGASDTSYEKVEGMNDNGPELQKEHAENAAPFSEKTVKENGPWHSDDENAKPPMGEIDPYFVYEDAPIYVPEHK